MMHHRQAHMHYFGGSRGNILGLLVLILLVILVIVLIVKLVQYLVSNKQTNSTYKSNANTILDERFSRGDIDVEEYRMRKEVLEEYKN